MIIPGIIAGQSNKQILAWSKDTGADSIILITNGTEIYITDDTSDGWRKAKGSILKGVSGDSGKFYYEMIIDDFSDAPLVAGFGIAATATDANFDWGLLDNANDSGRVLYFNTGVTGAGAPPGGGYDNYGDAWSGGDIIGVGVDFDSVPGSVQIRFYKNGVDQGLAYTKSMTTFYGAAGIRPHFCSWHVSSDDFYRFSKPSTLNYLPSGYSSWE